MTSKIATATVDPTAIHARAILVWLTISTWSARRYDKTVTQKVNAQYAATTDAGRYNKMLLPGDAQAYKELTALAGAIRAQHYAHTLAWSDEGWRILPTDNYMTYTTWFRQAQSEFRNKLTQFMADYPTMRAQARVLLNGLYKDEDYPTTFDLASKFTLGIQYAPVPASGDIRVDLASDQIATIESAIMATRDAAVKTAMSDAWTRLHDVVANISARLNEPKAIFRDSLINNAREVCDALSRLNVTGDPNLEAMRARVLSELTMEDPDILRDKPIIREQTAKRADDIIAAMSGLY